MLTNQEKLEIIKHLYLTQAFDRRAKLLQRTGRLGTFPSSRGQEHFYLACSWYLKKTDWYCPYYRDHAALMHRGMNPIHLFQYWGGDERGNTPPANTLPITVPIGSQAPHATGIAWSLKNTNNICVVTLGDGALSRGDVYESINFATIHQLPIIFAINNNRYAISTPLHMQSKEADLAHKFNGFGLKTRSVDGFDIDSLWQAFNETIHTCRTDRMPQLIHVNTYRLDDHTTADDSLRYRDQSEIDHHQKRCPIEKLAHQLKSTFGHDKLMQIQKDAKNKIDAIADQFLSQESANLSDIGRYTLEQPSQEDLQFLQQRISFYDDNTC